MPVRIVLERCVLRSWEPGDVDSLVLHANNVKVWRNVRDRFPYPYRREHAEAWVRAARARAPEIGLAIDVGGEAVGGIGIELQDDVYRRTAEIGYWLGEAHWGRGIATDAVRGMTEYAFANFDLVRLYAKVFEWNPASRRVLEKAGYSVEGRLRCGVTKDGQTIDEMLYAIVRHARAGASRREEAGRGAAKSPVPPRSHEETAARRDARTLRGSYAVPLEAPWRLDGAGRDPGAPLVLALHGMGMDENLFARLLRDLLALPYRFLIPRAPLPLEVRRERRVGAAWYAYDGDPERFRRDLDQVEGMLVRLLQQAEHEHGLRPRHRVLLGFSQGGYCGSVVALRNPQLFGGLVVCSGRVKTEMLQDEMRAAAAHGMRVLLCHGLRDVAVVHEAAERSRAGLSAWGVEVELRSFDSGHGLGHEQIEAIAAWLRAHDARIAPRPS